MGKIFDGILGVIFTIFIAFIGLIIITSSASARAANDYMQSSMQKIEASNYADSIIDSCKTDASSKGYTLEVTTCKNATTNKVSYGTATLKYVYYLPFVKMQKQRVINMDLR